MAIACVGVLASRQLGELPPIERHERMERRLVLGGGESACRASVPEGEREHRLLVANVGARRCIGGAQRDGVRVEAVVGVERSRKLEHEGGGG